MHLSQRCQNSHLFYTACCLPYNPLITRVLKSLSIHPNVTVQNFKNIPFVQKAWKTCVHNSVSDKIRSSSQTKGIMHGLVQKILETCERVANKFLHPGANYTYMYDLHTIWKSARVNGALVSKVSTKYKNSMFFCIIWRVLSQSKEGISHHFQNFCRILNIDGWNKCRGMASHKISLFYNMQRGRFPFFELLQLDMYAKRSVRRISPCNTLMIFFKCHSFLLTSWLFVLLTSNIKML